MASTTPEGGRTLICATILYWQTRELALLGRCVDSLLAQDVGDSAELKIILIDNGCGATLDVSADTSVELIRLPQNVGFAGGHNVGMRRAIDKGADYVLLFNSDAVAETGCVRRLVAAAQAWPSAAFVGPLIVRAADPERAESAGQSFNPWTARHHEMSRGAFVSSLDERPHRVDALSACALLARCQALENIGLLDDGLFMYFEDMDWCLRARRAGYEAVVAPAARVSHVGEGSTGGATPRSTFYSVRNHMIIAARYSGPICGRLLMVLALGYHLAFFVSSAERRNRHHLAALAQGAWAAWTGQLGSRRNGADWN